MWKTQPTQCYLEYVSFNAIYSWIQEIPTETSSQVLSACTVLGPGDTIMRKN